jgi:hypothetical protein
MRQFRSSGVQEFRSSGVQEFRSSGVQEFRSSGVQEFRSSGGILNDYFAGQAFSQEMSPTKMRDFRIL